MSVDEEIPEPVSLALSTIQGNWLCEELGFSLKVTGQTIQYSSGECYALEVTPEGKLEVFGYRGVGKKSDASSIVWKHKDTGHYLTWMYEGDNDEEQEPEVDASLIIAGTGGRTTRKRKVDYVALDKELDNQPADPLPTKQSAWIAEYEKQHTPSSTYPSQRDIASEFTRMKSKFEKWIRSTNTDRCKEILAKRGYLSTEIDYIKSSIETEAASRLVTYLKTIGVKASHSQSGTAVHARVPENVWKELALIPKARVDESEAPVDAELMCQVEKIKNGIVRYCESTERSANDTANIDSLLDQLHSLPIDLDILKVTKIGVEINKLSKINEKAKETLGVLKNIYLESKKVVV